MSIGREYMKATERSKLGPSDQQQGKPQPPLFRPYDGPGPIVDLPSPMTLPDHTVNFRTLVEDRQTWRRYAETPLTQQALSYLLWTTQGIKAELEHSTRRTVPSAGARHPFETYLLINNVEGLTPGLYFFLAREHKLGPVAADPGITGRIMATCLDQKQIAVSAATFIWVADSYRTTWRYGDRGYRYMHLDAGHVCQNLYLAAESIDCGVCAIAAFKDDEINPLLHLDGEEQFVIYLATVGPKQQR